MQTLPCQTCGEIFKIFPYEINRKYCSRKCFHEWRKKYFKFSDESKELISKSLLGNKRRVGHKPWIAGKRNIWAEGSKNVNWKGEDVGYWALHSRIRRIKDGGNLCEKCGKAKKGKNIQLANKSGKYLTDVSDWIYLCVSCHRKFDFANGRLRKGIMQCLSIRR